MWAPLLLIVFFPCFWNFLCLGCNWMDIFWVLLQWNQKGKPLCGFLCVKIAGIHSKRSKWAESPSWVLKHCFSGASATSAGNDYRYQSADYGPDTLFLSFGAWCFWSSLPVLGLGNWTSLWSCWELHLYTTAGWGWGPGALEPWSPRRFFQEPKASNESNKLKPKPYPERNWHT